MAMAVPHPHPGRQLSGGAIATALAAVALAAAVAFAVYQVTDDGGTTSGQPAAAVETGPGVNYPAIGIPEAVAPGSFGAAPVPDTFSPELARATSVAATAPGHPLGSTPGTPAIGGQGHPLGAAPSPGTPAAFAAIEAPAALKEAALAQSISDWVVDYAQAERILQGFLDFDDTVIPARPQISESAAVGSPDQALAENCTYWSTCDQIARAERVEIDTTPTRPEPRPNPNAGTRVQ